MAIRARLRRALRKSDFSTSITTAYASASDEIISPTESNTTVTTISCSPSLEKSPNPTSTLSKVFSFTNRDADRKSKSKQASAAGGRKSVHPSKRPLTLQNLRHQEMLGTFTMTFGATNRSQIETLSFCGVSPCCTRPASVDLDRDASSCPSALSLVAASPLVDSVRQ